jgi:hypothetical protein
MRDFAVKICANALKENKNYLLNVKQESTDGPVVQVTSNHGLWS